MEGNLKVMAPALALVIGVVKGWLIFRRASRKNIARIQAAPGPRWFWTVYPLSLYFLIPAMVALGVAIRRFLGEDYPWVVVLVYFSIGTAMLASSVSYFRAGGAAQSDLKAA